MLKRVIIGVVAVAVVVYAVLVVIAAGQHTNPPVVSEPNWDSPQTRQLAQQACFDCHSNETNWPVYSYLPPVSTRIVRSVNAGRRTLNFSDWQNVRGEGHNLGELGESIQGGWMPPRDYARLHPEAQLTADQRQALLDGLRATISASP